MSNFPDEPPIAANGQDDESVSKRFKSLGVLGSFHGTDVNLIYSGGDLTSYLVHFVNNLNPNGADVPEWPQFTLQSKQVLTLLDGDTPVTIGKDDYRAQGIELLEKIGSETAF